MTSPRVAVFGACVAGDDALTNSRWVAEQSAERLGASALRLFDESAVRGELERAMSESDVTGLVLCGHGDGGKNVFVLRNQHHERDERWLQRYADTSEVGAVYGSDDDAALDFDNIALTRGRWVHAMVCELGFSPLPQRAVSSGALAFAAYEESLVPEFTVSSLPPSATSILGDIATRTTLALAAGTFDRDTLAADVRRASEALDEWFDSDEGQEWADRYGFERVGLTKFSKQLSSALRVVSVER